MPTYDYVCDACKHAFEHFQSITSPVMRKCPECGKLKLRRLIGIGAGVIFRGSGFYQTDYRSDGYKKAASADKTSSSSSTSSSASDSSSSSTATDSKPAAKKDSAAGKVAG
jgi:putative FmdB family regulatory protein